MRYFQDALIAAFPSSSGEKVPPTYKYFVDIVNILRDMRPEKLTDKSILCGSPQHIVDTLKTVEAAGVAEVILYFNYGQKPHAHGEGADGALHEGGRAALCMTVVPTEAKRSGGTFSCE